MNFQTFLRTPFLQNTSVTAPKSDNKVVTEDYNLEHSDPNILFHE